MYIILPYSEIKNTGGGAGSGRRSEEDNTVSSGHTEF